MSDEKRGANAIEYALTLPIVIVLVFAIAEYGYYFYQRSAVAGAVHDGCRSGALVSPDTDDPIEVARRRIGDGLALFDVSHVEVTLVGDPPDESLACTAEVVHHRLLGLIPVPNRYESRAALRLEIQR